MSGTILRRRDRTARPPRVEHYSSAVNIPATFDGFTRDLEAMAAWLSSCGVKKVAMESTSV